MRAALLPTPGDPFLIAYWLRHFRTWRTEVDELRVLVNGQRIPEVWEYIRAKAKEAGALLHEMPDRLDHGKAIGYLLEQTQADQILLCEDDAFLRTPGKVDAAFRRIESGEVDIVACPRSSVSDEVRDAAVARYGSPPPVVSHESGHSFWPAFFFARRSDLMATDRHFSAYAWPKGTEVPELGITTQNDAAGDTFVHTTYQLREMGLRIRWESQFRADREAMDWWLQYAPWFHVGSLSAGYGYTFWHEASGYPDSLEPIAIEARKTRSDWEKRMSWWYRVTETDALPAHRARYRADLERFIDIAQLDRREISRWTERFQPWITW